MIERVVRNDEVVGLIPIWSTNSRRFDRSAGPSGRFFCVYPAPPAAYLPAAMGFTGAGDDVVTRPRLGWCIGLPFATVITDRGISRRSYNPSMSTSKKTSSKSSKSPAPATKSAASKSAPAPRAKVKVAAKPAAKAAPAVVAAPVVVPTPAPKPQAAKPVQTVISAKLDVGFGNALYIRGEGAGLSWDAGVPMECVEANLWRVTLPESARGYAFKFLVNDLTWSTGPDFTAASGASVTLTPEF